MTHERPMDNRLLVTTVEAARLLGIGRSTLYRLIRERRIPARRLGRQVRISLDAVTAFADSLDRSEP